MTSSSRPGPEKGSASVPTSAMPYSSFFGQTVDSTSVLVRYTPDGDANLDGTINTQDFTALATINSIPLAIPAIDSRTLILGDDGLHILVRHAIVSDGLIRVVA